MPVNGRNFVFLDPKGRRWLWTRLFAVVTVLFVLASFFVFIRALCVKPELHLPDAVRVLKLQLRALAKTAPSSAERLQPWMAYQQKAPVKATPKVPLTSGRISAALLAGWDPRSIKSLTDHAAELTHVCPDMLFLTGQPAQIHVEAGPELLDVLKASKLQVIPILSNLAGDRWDTDAVEGLIQTDDASQQKFFDSLAQTLKSVGGSGVLLDWQGMDPALAPKLTAFLGKMSTYLHAQQMQLWLSIPVGDDLKVFDLDTLPDVVDRFVAQLHDKSAEDDPPGPVASQDWFEGWLNTFIGYGDKEQWILSLGSYGYDWNLGNNKTTAISFADAMARAQRAGVDQVSSAAPDYNPGFSYDLDGASHEIWFLDAATFANQLRAATKSGCGGIMLNRLGTEDPGVWSVLEAEEAATKRPALFQTLQKIDPAGTIAQIGEGDFLRAEMTSAPGNREFAEDAAGYVTENYLQWPTFPTVVHLGTMPDHQVALTFDDGPDPEWTPQILDILKKRHVQATFFMLGVQAEAHPDLVRRVLREGHTIGSHTYTHPNLSVTSPEKIVLELNATQRLLEWITGRSTILFRPPYNADSLPASVEDAAPIALATSMGYISVGESVDPQDWDRPGVDEIVRRVHDQRNSGNVILLHDAGGDRSQTVAALPRILDFLEGRGDTIIPVEQLIGLSRDDAMPKIEEKESPVPRLITNIGLLLAHWAEEILWSFMILASILTVGRSLILAGLAIRRRDEPAPLSSPPLSILVAAYNEEKVIAATLRSLLATDYAGLVEIVVVDDGSKDDTAACAQEIADTDNRVKVISQVNTGKAGALEAAMAAATHDVLVLVDADTQFQKNTLTALVRPLGRKEVGAVSGHSKVGNLSTLISRFQGLEYICGFNLDRRAYDYLNCITVVPGAISAFKREAIVEAGGFAHDTLAEDTDLTLALHRFGWVVTYAPDAIAWTEAPETVKALATQRFRWAFGTMQCLWKHRDMLFSPQFRALGLFSLPSIVFFQIILVATMPATDFLLIISLLTGAGAPFVIYFFAFLVCDLCLALLACKIEGEKLRRAAWIIPMRFLYRPLLSWVVWRSILHILRGAWVGWDKLERKGGVNQPATNP